MDWFKKHFDRIILAVVGLLVLVFAGLIIVNILNFEQLFEEQKNFRPANNELPAPATEALVKRTESLSSPAEWAAHEGSLFVSEPFISVDGGKPENPFNSDTALFPPIDNKWIVENNIDFSDANIRNADPDGDKFTNLEEFLGKTDPNDPQSRPGYASKLRLVEWVKEPFRLKFSGSPDEGETFTVNTLDLRQPTQFRKIGEMVEGTPYKLIKHEAKTESVSGLDKDVSELTVENQETGEQIVLIYDKVIDSPTQFARMSYLWDGSELKVKKLDSFSLEPEANVSYKLIDISDTQAVIENAQTQERITVPKAD